MHEIKEYSGVVSNVYWKARVASQTKLLGGERRRLSKGETQKVKGTVSEEAKFRNILWRYWKDKLGYES